MKTTVQPAAGSAPGGSAQFPIPVTSLNGALPGPRLAGRRILVVGGGQRAAEGAGEGLYGNGRATSITLARHGAMVACADINPVAARATCEEIDQAGGAAFPIVADVSREEDITRMVGEAAAAMGGLDGLVLNTGIGGGQSGLSSQTMAVWDDVFAVNVRSHAFTCRDALAHLGPGSAIVFVSSVASRRPGTGMPAYDSSKASLAGLCRHVAYEGEPRGIRANVVIPGYMDTPNGRAATRRRPERADLRLPFGRQGTGWEVANAILFLLSDEAAYVNAQCLSVDGGYVELGLR